jgi:NAD(P)-dependent dehydrogenase (short-subunit alcohol dehydrogenase family)
MMFMDLTSLSGKVALVTGAADGIGAEIARLYAEHGAAVVLGDVADDKGEATAAGIAKAGHRASFIHHDVTDEAQWAKAVEHAIAKFGGLNILVNNAAIEEAAHLADLDIARARRLLDINVAGVLLGHKYAARTMRPGGPAGRGGIVVNLSSVAGLIGTPGLGAYSASKGAVRLLSKAAAVEFGVLGYGIRVNSIHPGFVKTAMGDNLVGEFIKFGMLPDGGAAYEAMTKTYPLGRTGVPADIARIALFLASDLSSWVTGAEIVVDGGMTIS